MRVPTTPEGHEHESGLWLGHVRAGLWVSVAIVVTVGIYLIVTPTGPNRVLLWYLLGAGTLVTLTAALLPWRRIIARGRVLPLLYAWTTGTIPLLVLLAGLDGGPSSPMALLLIVPLAFAAMSYPPVSAGVTGAVVVVAQLGLVVVAGDGRPMNLLFHAATFSLVALMGVLIARNHTAHASRVNAMAGRLEALVHIDGLTGALNHRALHQQLRSAVGRARRSGAACSLLLADLDHFKLVNDQHGHPLGDDVLVATSNAIIGAVREGDEVARIGGEEFAIVLPDTGTAAAVEVAERIRFAVGGVERPVPVTVSIGASTLPDHADHAEGLLVAADQALYAAKRGGRDRVAVAGRHQTASRSDTAGATDRIDALLDDPSRLQSVYQPIVDLATGTTVAFEALARVTDSQLAPDRWLELAAQVGRRAELEAAMWDVALAGWGERTGVVLFINASVDALETAALRDRAELLPAGTVIEVSERWAVSSYLSLVETLVDWQERGVRLAIDDVGAGQANLRHVLELEPDFVKLDRSLVAGVDRHRKRATLVRALGQFTFAAGIEMIAEGVETDAETAALRGCGVRLAQGYALGRPGALPPVTQPLAAS